MFQMWMYTLLVLSDISGLNWENRSDSEKNSIAVCFSSKEPRRTEAERWITG